MLEGGDQRADRRDFLRLGTAGLALSLGGCSDVDESPDGETPATATPGSDTPHDPAPTAGASGNEIPFSTEFDTVVDMTADADVDPTGAESIVPQLEAQAGEDTLLYFPSGRYLMDEVWRHRRFSNLGVVGDGATIVPLEGYTGNLFGLGSEDGAARLRFEGFEFDLTEPESIPVPLRGMVTEELVVRDITVTGRGRKCRFDVTGPDGAGRVERLRRPDGGVDQAGCFVGPKNRGTLTFIDCRLSGFPDNGLYASPSEGPVRVFGGFYHNNDIANIRVSSPSLVRGVHVRCDRTPPGFQNMRGIRIRHGHGRVVVEDSLVEMLEGVHRSSGAVVVEPHMGTATVRNSRIRASADGVPAINARSPNHRRTASVDCLNVDVSGSASNGTAVRIVDRDGCRIEHSHIRQDGENRDGISLIRSRNVVLCDVRIEVTGDPLVAEGTGPENRDVAIGRGDPARFRGCTSF